MMQSPNKAIIACAGAGKTTKIIDEALQEDRSRRIAIITYTNLNTEQVINKLYKKNKVIPPNITVTTWISFLLNELVRPYQHYVYSKQRIESVAQINGNSAKFKNKKNAELYYFSNGKDIYTDKISEFIISCNEKSEGKPIARLSKAFNSIYIDEVQDLAGYDLELLKLFLESKIRVTIVGDTRQATYTTHAPRIHKKYKGEKIIELIKIWEKKHLLTIEQMSTSYRCNQDICDLGHQIYPNYPIVESTNKNSVKHSGIFIVHDKDVEYYIKEVSPQILRYNKNKKTLGNNPINFGESKGLEFEHTLIYPTGEITNFLKEGKIKEKSKAKFYVAITRAFHSVAIVYEENSCTIKTAKFYNREQQMSLF